jgi:membrane protein DedA with SNARE-associated domain
MPGIMGLAEIAGAGSWPDNAPPLPLIPGRAPPIPLLGSNQPPGQPRESEHVFDAIIDFMTHEVARYGYLAVFVLMVAESACVPIPSEVTMLFGGALAAAGFAAPGQALNLVWVALWGTVGNLVGSWLAYWVGYAGGRPLLDRWGRYLLITPHEIDRAHEWFERHGEAAVFFSRLLPVVRTFISLPAGVARMNFWKFTLYTVLGCLPWTFALAFAGYKLGENWDTVDRIMRPFSLALALIFLVLLAWWIARRVRKVRAGSSVGPTSSSGV